MVHVSEVVDIDIRVADEWIMPVCGSRRCKLDRGLGGVERAGLVCTEKGPSRAQMSRKRVTAIEAQNRLIRRGVDYWDDEGSEMEELAIAFRGGGVRQGPQNKDFQRLSVLQNARRYEVWMTAYH